jgi:hypothetical protein
VVHESPFVLYEHFDCPQNRLGGLKDQVRRVSDGRFGV